MAEKVMKNNDEIIQFLDLKKNNKQYREELIEASTRVIDSGWYIRGNEVSEFEKNFANYCETEYCISVANGKVLFKFR